MKAQIVGLFSSRHQAENAVSLLKGKGFEEDSISLLMRDQDIKEAEPTTVGGLDSSNQEVILGTAGGAGIGFGAGLAASFASLAIPGLGPVLSAGILISLFTAVGGAVGGAVLGGLNKMGINENDAHVYAEGVRRGGVLVAVESDEANADAATSALRQADAQDIDALRQRWQRDGWSAFDDTMEPGEKYPAF